MRRRGRGWRLTVDGRDGAVRLALPPRAALRPALAWAADKRAWVEAELAKLPAPRPLMPGLVFEWAGERLVLDWRADLPRTPRLLPGRLALGGPPDLMPARALRWLRADALRLLTAETAAMAARHGIAVERVAVGDPRGRWGSCSAAGAIRYSWRLVLAPPFVRRATVAHELAHRLHMNHSPAFHAAAARILGEDPRPARVWLRAHGAELHWFGREA